MSTSSRTSSHAARPWAGRRSAGGYRLVRAPRTPPGPVPLDAHQRAVVEHRTGPLLVLAGPGTGKTETLVESVAARVAAGADPERLLVLTFSRKAAVSLRDRMALRIGPASAPRATTFHSYGYALVRAHQEAGPDGTPVRLLSGPEQDLAVRELLEGETALAAQGRGRVRWPGQLRACLTTRGFADEVRAVLARSRELGLDPAALHRFASRTGRPDWQAAAAFLAEYLDVLDLQGVIDYAELVHRADLLARRPDVAKDLAQAYDAVYVDEYQDTDPAQVRLLEALAGQGRTLLAFGDPDQSIYAFRGADVNGILDFPDTFRTTGGAPAPVAVLPTARRAARRVLDATRALTLRIPLTRLPAAAVRAHRDQLPTREGGGAEVYTCPSPGAETDHVADLLRRAHLEDDVPWGDMAVLLRAGSRLPALRRSLTAAGVPVDTAGDELPLRLEPAVQPLLTALRVTAEAEARGETPQAGETPPVGETPAGEGESGPVPEGDSGPDGDSGPEAEGEPVPEGEIQPVPVPQPSPEPSWIATETAVDLLASPLCGMDAADLRRLGRALRAEERAGGNPVPPPSDVLLARALAEPERLIAHDAAYAKAARELGLLLARTRSLLAKGGTAEEALWELWNGTRWPARLERASRRGGAAGRNADRDLDAVCALFATAARAEERTGGRGALNFLAETEAQEIAADTLSGRTVRPDAVRLMTAHRAKGLQWRLVVVAGVQEGVWPDLRQRGSLLEADRIGSDGLAEPLTPGALLAEERRLFYVAATRAADRLVVTAVKAPAEDGDQPSRFLTELGVEPRHLTVRPRRPLAVPALVAELRATTVDPHASPALREAAARRLARLAALTDGDGRPLVPTAHPGTWWGLADETVNEVPVRDPAQPLALSASALGQLVDVCALQWFLGREVRAEAPASTAQGFGNVVHVLADEVATGRSPADLDVLMERLDTVWDGLAFDAPWKSAQEKENARAALERFLRWHVLDRTGRTPVASEHPFDVTLPAGDHEIRIRGTMDRVDADAAGRAYVVDFKTGKNAPTADEVDHHPQLAVYQRAVAEGAVGPLTPGGAELVHLRLEASKKDPLSPKVQPQDPPEGDWLPDLLTEAAARVLNERFRPTPGSHCDHCAFRASCSAKAEGGQVVE
ncbi:ATP-dependent helicase [Streptomyces sp. NPDC001255]|uniref:ATP-dependent helicase n=1 Tax=Streptomyces sp. NPDC001255 TaxID=3364550 RepID=UPI0036A97D50